MKKRVKPAGSTGLLIGRRLKISQRRPIGFEPQQESALPADTDEWVTYDGPSHILTAGPTGAGKTTHIINNALLHNGPMVIFDSKGEIYRATARRRREMGQEVHVLDLGDKHRKGEGSLNPLDLAMRSGSETAVIARGLAAHIVARTGEERENFWQDWAETCIAGGIGYALGLPPESRHIGSVFDLFNSADPSYDIAVFLDREGKTLNRATRTALNGLLNLPTENTRPSVLGVTQSVLRLWDSELVRRVTSTTSFDLDAFVHRSDAHPMTLYIIVPFELTEAFRPLLRLWFSGLLSVLMQRERLPRHKTLIVSDETASFGKLQSFVAAATQARSFGVRLWTNWQNIAQLQIYGKDGAHTLVDNAGVLQILGAPNHRSAEEYASLVGGISGEEILKLSPREQLVFIDGKLERLGRVRYFEEVRFAGQYDAPMKGLGGA